MGKGCGVEGAGVGQAAVWGQGHRGLLGVCCGAGGGLIFMFYYFKIFMNTFFTFIPIDCILNAIYTLICINYFDISITS